MHNKHPESRRQQKERKIIFHSWQAQKINITPYAYLAPTAKLRLAGTSLYQAHTTDEIMLHIQYTPFKRNLKVQSETVHGTRSASYTGFKDSLFQVQGNNKQGILVFLLCRNLSTEVCLTGVLL